MTYPQCSAALLERCPVGGIVSTHVYRLLTQNNEDVKVTDTQTAGSPSDLYAQAGMRKKRQAESQLVEGVSERKGSGLRGPNSAKD